MGPMFNSFVEAASNVSRCAMASGRRASSTRPHSRSSTSAPRSGCGSLQINIVRLRSFAGDLGERFVDGQYSRRLGGDGRERRRLFPSQGRRRPDRPPVADHADQGDRHQFQSVLDCAAVAHQEGPDPEDEGGSELSDGGEDPRHQQGRPGGVAAAINWNTDEATHYSYRQDTGADVDALGAVRINIHNPYGVYMHDTPEKGIFGDDFRFVSSGCVRVQDVRDYVAWLLKDNPGWGRDQIDEAIRSGQRLDVKLAQAGQRLLGLYHRLGDARRHRAVPAGHLSARRRGPGPDGLRSSRAADGAAAGIAQALASSRRGTRFRTDPTGAAWINAIASFETRRSAPLNRTSDGRTQAEFACGMEFPMDRPPVTRLALTERANRETWSRNYISAKSEF